MERFTTEERDLVIAVWVDCPRYEIPSNCKALRVAALLEDAIR